jgi:uncharacterized protein
MSSEHVNRVLCAGQPRGSADAVNRLLALADEQRVQAIALVGDLGNGGDGLRDVFGALGAAGLPVFWVPGPGDAAADRYPRWEAEYRLKILQAMDYN